MSKFILPASILLLGAAAWFWRAEIETWARPLAAKVQPAAPSAGPAQASGLRKCVRGADTVYTNEPCPAGFQVKAVDASRLSVVPGTPVEPPVSAASAGSAPNAHERLQNALDVKPDPRLSGRMIERAVSGQSK